MRIAEVIGRITMSRLHPNIKAGRFVIVLPMTKESLVEGAATRGDEVIAFDNLGASPGALVGLSESREAANPFGKTKVPIDAYCALLIDQIDV